MVDTWRGAAGERCAFFSVGGGAYLQEEGAFQKAEGVLRV